MTNTANAARTAYDMAFQISPIILTGGIVANTQGSALPIITFLKDMKETLAFLAPSAAQAVAGNGLSLDDFIRFVPLPGSTVISNAIGTYPFANQQVAANAIINQPLNISFQMIAPVNTRGGYLSKLAIFTSLRNTLASHNAAGGTYSIATPSYVYTNCIMTAMTDITSGETRQQQILWQLDFVQPLITQQQATAAQNGLMSKLTGGQQVRGSWSNIPGVPAQGALSASQLVADVPTFYAQGGGAQ